MQEVHFKYLAAKQTLAGIFAGTQISRGLFSTAEGRQNKFLA